MLGHKVIGGLALAVGLWVQPAFGGVHALLLNGGDRPVTNYQSHLHHLQEVHRALVQRGVPADHITVFSADGEHAEPDMAVRITAREEAAWMIEDTSLGRLTRHELLVDSEWPEVELRPATGDALRRWFLDAAYQLVPGDTLLVYVTDHGRKGQEGLEDATIALWREVLTVAEFRTLLGLLHPDVQVVMSMSQCFSASFAQALYPVEGSVPAGNRCGWFSAPADRPSYGCYAEGRERYIGHGFRWSRALTRNQSLADAHAEVVFTDRTPDVPLATSDVHLTRLLREEALRVGLHTAELTDLMLANILTNPDENTLRHLERADALATSIGVDSPRSMAAIEALRRPLTDLQEGLSRGSSAWNTVLDDARERHLQDFLHRNPRWKRRLDRLIHKPRRAAHGVPELLEALQLFTVTHPEAHDRLLTLRSRQDMTRQGAWRTAVREAVVLRMATILRRIAAEALLRSDDPHFDEHRAALAALQICEQASPGTPLSVQSEAVRPTPFPGVEADEEILRRATPGYLGVDYGPVSASLTERHQLAAGAMALHTVYDDSPGARAGLQAGDVLLGPPEAPFAAPTSLLEWTLSVPWETPQTLRLLRGDKTWLARVSLTAWPSTDAQPDRFQAGDLAPPLSLTDLGGDPIQIAGEDVLLFYWATWCRPCKAAVPDLLAWSRDNGVKVVAVTDETPYVLERWRKRFDDPFPEIIAVDGSRASYEALAIARTPSFLHISAGGLILARQQGYSKVTGLFP